MNNLELENIYSDCTLCPRACHADRYHHAGFCGAGTNVRLARAALHFWEEPCLIGDQEKPAGAGAVFFSHCTLKCLFCQNYDISSEGFGKDVSIRQLADIMLRLESEGAACIDLVTASHYIPSVIAALDLVRHKLRIPVVFNCGGYESVEALKLLDGYIDIYLPDLKYFDDGLAVRYSSAPHYFRTALAAIREMIRQTGDPVFRSPSASGETSGTEILQPAGDTSSDSSGTLLHGVIIRHMVLPGCRKDSIALLSCLAEELGREHFLISLLSQYTPFFHAKDHPEINRRITSFEYDSVLDHAVSLGLHGFMQEKSSAKEEYTPSFDLEGVY